MNGRATRLGPIDSYLKGLRDSLGSRPDADDIVAEAEDHLRETAGRLIRSMDQTEAESAAVERYGDVAVICRGFAAEGKGVAMPSKLSRSAGIAAVLIPLTVLVGAVINEAVPRGFVHGIGVMLLVSAFPLATLFFAGLWHRHGGALGRSGKIALGLLIAAPFLSAPFSWGAPVAFAFFLAVASTMLALGVARAGMLPAAPAVLLAIGPAFTVAVGAAGAYLGFDGGLYMPFGLAPLAIGLLWLGLAMARENPVEALSV